MSADLLWVGGWVRLSSAALAKVGPCGWFLPLQLSLPRHLPTRFLLCWRALAPIVLIGNEVRACQGQTGEPHNQVDGQHPSKHRYVALFRSRGNDNIRP